VEHLSEAKKGQIELTKSELNALFRGQSIEARGDDSSPALREISADLQQREFAKLVCRSGKLTVYQFTITDGALKG
jgi:hypothetical protein